MKRTFGYTLVEALVAIGLIGVIAALAIPSLVNEYNKQVYAKTLKVAISDFETAMSAMMMKEGVTSLTETEAWKAIIDSDGRLTLYNDSSPEVIKEFRSHLNEVLPIKDTYTDERSYKALGADYDFNLNATLGFLTKKNVEYQFGFASWSIPNVDEKEIIASGKLDSDFVGSVNIDINGKKPPNRMGRDEFLYNLSNDGILTPSYHFPDLAYEDLKSLCLEPGIGCSEYLRRNNYKMDY